MLIFLTSNHPVGYNKPVTKEKEEVMIENWLANAYEGMSRRQFLARLSAAGVGLAGFALAADPVGGEVITTPAGWPGKAS